MKDLQTVLDALEQWIAEDADCDVIEHDRRIKEAISIVKQMIQTEPVAWRSQLASGSYTYCNTPEYFDNAEPIYASPVAPQAVPAVVEHLIRGVEPLYATPFVATPLSKGARLSVFSDAETTMRRNPELSWRDAIVDQVELAHGIGGSK